MLLGTHTSEDGSLVLVGRPYRRLVDDLIANPALARFELAAAAGACPKQPGGLNIEGMTAPPRAQPVDFHGLNPEAFVTFEDLDAFLVLSDDGRRLVDGVACKKLKDPSRKRFRGMWIRPAPARASSRITPP
jgi:hypothetical protein